MSRRGTAPAAVLAIALGAGLATGGCGAPRLARAPSLATDLGGHWILDPAASDDAAATIAAALPKHAPTAARDAGRDPETGGTGDGANGGRRGGNGRGGGRGGSTSGSSKTASAAAPSAAAPPLSRRGAGELLRAFALPAVRLDIAAEPGRIALGTGERQRRFEPGAEDPVAVSDRFGSRNVTAGWSAAEFLVVSADGSRLNVVEHYRRGSGDTLESLVEVSAAGLKKVRVHAVYRRASAVEAAAPASDGPPAPAPR